MSLPDDWWIEHEGQRLVLDRSKVEAEIARLREVIKSLQPSAAKAAYIRRMVNGS